ncbi:hypothetical protein AN963_02685 [Brevibacillus choshinensis]|uniref:Nucleotide-diphospho-sugar transferase domain-containing protein n=1 Tax=Brevibacillus choshinensis TaxID=54911 RepID=A0ABR5NAZ5_BRECH|nr:hypothetical protein [Brevibacillus choshinensis]KQL48724.1 hypothetical protein AN963_02685 [Brevibacillus choshinensis]
MSVPIIFLHRSDDSYLFYILRQAKIASPSSDVVLIGSPANMKYASQGIKHALIQDYSHGANEFAAVYKHLSPCEYYYNLFCFQRWFILRDYMRGNNLNECWTLDSDVMLYADLSREEYKTFSNEFTWTTYITLKEVEELCAVTQDHFSNPHLFEYLKQYTRETGNYIKETGMLAVSDMVTQRLYLENVLKKDRIHGIINNSFFDNNLFFSFPGVETLDNKKKIYMLNGTLYSKKMDTGQFMNVNTVHFTSEANKKYIPHFYKPNLLGKANGAYYFHYNSLQWVSTSI